MNFSAVAGRFTSFLRGEVERFDARDEREFLPAALEVLETPPSPASRAVAMTIGAFFLVALAWAFLGKVDILATAAGRVLPSGKIKIVQPLDEGTVRAIHVQDGDHVRAGQVLIELDPTIAGADREKVVRDLVQAQLDVARLTALKNNASGGAIAAPPGASNDDLSQAKATLRAQADEQAAKVAGLDQQISEKRAEAAQVAAEIAKLNATIPMLAEKEHLHQKLHDEGYGTSFAYLDAQQQLTEARHDLQVDADRAAQAEDSRVSLQRQRDEAISQFAASVFDDLAKAQQRASELTQELVKAQQKSADTTLRSPIDGVVEELAAHTIGGVVTPAQRLLVVVPDNQKLIVEAQLPNRDVGFVHKGQEVAVKVETFNFTRYGMLRGKVTDVSRDAVAAQDRQADDSLPDAGGQRPPVVGSPTYLARVSLDRSSMDIDGRRQPLVPGMAVTAEIKTGRRTIIDYLLSPLARRTSESLHER
ncbi:MAG: HlyD family type I secretion periplasmic adaptor subunit [Caulobacteraceae bacterium]